MMENDEANENGKEGEAQSKVKPNTNTQFFFAFAKRLLLNSFLECFNKKNQKQRKKSEFFPTKTNIECHFHGKIISLCESRIKMHRRSATHIYTKAACAVYSMTSHSLFNFLLCVDICLDTAPCFFTAEPLQTKSQRSNFSFLADGLFCIFSMRACSLR